MNMQESDKSGVERESASAFQVMIMTLMIFNLWVSTNKNTVDILKDKNKNNAWTFYFLPKLL